MPSTMPMPAPMVAHANRSPMRRVLPCGLADRDGRGDTAGMGGNGLGAFLVAVVSVLAAIGLVGLCLIGWVVWRYRVPMRGVVAMVGALIYLVSPVDVLPESLLGPFGLIDDAGVVGATVLFVYKLIKVRQMLDERGVSLRRPARGRASSPLRPAAGTPRGFPLDRQARETRSQPPAPPAISPPADRGH